LTLSRDGYQEWTQEIRLDSPQLIRANLTPLADQSYEGGDSPGGASAAESEVDATLRGWADSLNGRDLGSNMSYYAEHLDTFLTMSDVSSDEVRATRTKLFGKYSSISINLSNIHINVDPAGSTAVVTLDIDYEFRGAKSLTGKAQNEIRLEKRGNRWLINNEKHIQTYFEASS
jgi:ketosteroid isomerase-like protein